jgi:hypothetical protein
MAILPIVTLSLPENLLKKWWSGGLGNEKILGILHPFGDTSFLKPS